MLPLSTHDAGKIPTAASGRWWRAIACSLTVLVAILENRLLFLFTGNIWMLLTVQVTLNVTAFAFYGVLSNMTLDPNNRTNSHALPIRLLSKLTICNNLVQGATLPWFLGSMLDADESWSLLHRLPFYLQILPFWGGVFLAVEGVLMLRKALFDQFMLPSASWEQRFPSSGIYSIVRHPAFCAMLHIAFAGSVVSGSVMAALTTAVFVTQIIAFSIREERMFERLFGAEYGRYRRATPALSPDVRNLPRLWKSFFQ